MDTTVYYCWACEQRITGEPYGAETHYESGRDLRFCSEQCWKTYLWLKEL